MSAKLEVGVDVKPRRKRFGRIDINTLMNANGASEVVARKDILEIPLEAVVEDSPFQRRDPFDPHSNEKDRSLVDSINELGLLYPVGLTEIETGKFQVVYGHRRIAALRYLEKETVRAYLISGEALDLATKTTVENTVVPPSPIHQAELAQLYAEKYGLTNKQIAVRLGCSVRHIIRLRKILQADEAIRLALHDGQISANTARALAQAPDKCQPRLAQIAAEHRVTEKEAKRLVDHIEATGADPDEAVTTLGLVFSAPETVTGNVGKPSSRNEKAQRGTQNVKSNPPAPNGDKPQHRITKASGAINRQLISMLPTLDRGLVQALAHEASQKGATWKSARIAGMLALSEARLVEKNAFSDHEFVAEVLIELLDVAAAVEDEKLIDMALDAAKIQAAARDVTQHRKDDVPAACRTAFLSLGKLFTELGDA